MKNYDIDPVLVKEAQSILATLGLPIETAITLFLRQVVLHNGLPFSVTLPVKETRPPHDNIVSEGESLGWMGELFEDLLKETEAVKAECEQDKTK